MRIVHLNWFVCKLPISTALTDDEIELPFQMDADKQNMNVTEENMEFLFTYKEENGSVDVGNETFLLDLQEADEEKRKEEEESDSDVEEEEFSLELKEESLDEEESVIEDEEKCATISNADTRPFIASDEFSLEEELIVAVENPVNREEKVAKKTKNGNRQGTCPICRKSFNKLAEHMKVHEDRRAWEHECPTCGIRLPTMWRLKKHFAWHDEKKFICSLCNSAFHEKRTLEIHYSVHTGEKAYKCEICSNEYKRLYALNVHRKKVHSVGKTLVPKREKKFTCDQCDSKFKYTEDLRVHMRSHSGEKPFECEICGKHFACMAYVRKHVKRQHVKKE